MDCQWVITVDPAFTLKLEIYDIDLDSNYSSPFGSGCSDSLQVRGPLRESLNIFVNGKSLVTTSQ